MAGEEGEAGSTELVIEFRWRRVGRGPAALLGRLDAQVQLLGD